MVRETDVTDRLGGEKVMSVRETDITVTDCRGLVRETDVTVTDWEGRK